MDQTGGDESEAGDRPTFDSFYADSLPHLLGLARLLTGDAGRAEDLAQETYWRVHRAWPRLQHAAAAPAYARTVMVRLAIRSRRRHWSGEQPTPNDRLDELGGAYDDQNLATIDESELLDRALAALPAKQRAVLVLRYYDDRSEAEIAELLRCSTGTVKSRAARALASLRRAGVDAQVERSAEPTRPRFPQRQEGGHV